MLPAQVFVLAAVLFGVALLWYVLRRRGKPGLVSGLLSGAPEYADEREERLTGRLARATGCSPREALPFVRHETAIAPSQTDETLLKRARYHYSQSLPERSCSVYRDQSPG